MHAQAVWQALALMGTDASACASRYNASDLSAKTICKVLAQALLSPGRQAAKVCVSGITTHQRSFQLAMCNPHAVTAVP